MNFGSTIHNFPENKPGHSILSTEQIRNEILDLIILTLTVFSVPAVLISAARAIDIGWRNVMFLHFGLSVSVFLLYAFRNRISYRYRAAIISGVCLVTATCGLLCWGLIGMGDLFFLLFIILAGSFLSFRAGIFAIIISFLIMLCIGIGVSFGKIKYNFDMEEYSTAISSWTMLIIGVSCFSTIAMFAINRIWKILLCYTDEINYRASELLVKNQMIQEETSLRENIEERYNAIFNRSFDLIFIHDFDGNFVDANSAALKLTGYEQEDIKRLKFDSFIGQEKIPYALNRSQRIKETGGDNDLVTIKIRCKNKEYKSIEERGSLLLKDGKPFGVLAIGRDITEKKSKETELLNNLHFTRELIEKLPNPIFYYDASGRYIGCNKAYADLIGTTVERILRSNLTDFSFNITDSIHRETDEELFRDGGIRRYNVSSVLSDFEAHELAINKAAFKQIDGSIGGIVASVFDATEIKKLENQLYQSQKMESIGKLAGGVAHDFNNLLTIIMGNTEVLMNRSNNDKEMMEEISQIQKAAQRAESLTRQLLAFSRKQVLEPKIVNINFLITDISKMLSRVIGEDIELTLKLSEGLGNVEVDPGQIDQILMNLAVNARDAMIGGGKLTIETEDVFLDEPFKKDFPYVLPGPYIRLSISDNGIGMDEDTKAHIFEPFFTTKPQESGTGLGLSTVYGIVKQSNGYILVFSEQGKGTTFNIYFARTDRNPPNHMPPNGEVTDMHGTETVLLVEDDELVREVAAGMLERFGYDVVFAKDGEDALHISKVMEKEIDLVVTDVIMPGMNGRELVGLLEEQCSKTIKAVYMSGYTNNVIVNSGILYDDINFIQKPFKAIDFARKIREVLNG